MFKVIVTFILYTFFVVLAVEGTALPLCEENEEYKKCGLDCPASCLEPFRIPCAVGCVEGCLCKKGYLRENRDGSGKCIKFEECPPPACGEHEEYDFCGASVIPKTCQSVGAESTFCESPGCRCVEGYLREFVNGTGKCVPENECVEPICVENEQWDSCGDYFHQPACEDRDGYKNVPPCLHPNCVCKEGYIREEESFNGGRGKCILIEECPKHTCGEHEEYSDCGTACPLNCLEPIEGFCTADCVEGCFCEEGYLRENRDGSGKCIKFEECPTPACGEHEEYDFCGATVVPKTCQTVGLELDVCDFPGCRCVEGYLKEFANGTGKCVPENECVEREPICGENEQWDSCGDYFSQPSCEDRDGFISIFPCTYPSCVCKEGHIREKESYNGGAKCILIEECPSK